MVPMHGTKVVGAFHEPPVWSPGFSRSGPPEGGTPYRWHDPDGFMVPMHGIEVVGALHEPQYIGSGLQGLGDLVQSITVGTQRRGDDGHVLLHLGPLALFDGLAHARKGFYAVTSVESRGIDHVAVPFTPGQPLRMNEGLLHALKQAVQAGALRLAELGFGSGRSRAGLVTGLGAALELQQHVFEWCEIEERHARLAFRQH